MLTQPQNILLLQQHDGGSAEQPQTPLPKQNIKHIVKQPLQAEMLHTWQANAATPAQLVEQNSVL